MPLSKYNAQFGGKKDSARKAHDAMVKQYGAKKGEQVFYATKNKRSGSSNSKRAKMIAEFQRKHGGKRGRSKR